MAGKRRSSTNRTSATIRSRFESSMSVFAPDLDVHQQRKTIMGFWTPLFAALMILGYLCYGLFYVSLLHIEYFGIAGDALGWEQGTHTFKTSYTVWSYILQLSYYIAAIILYCSYHIILRALYYMHIMWQLS